MLVVMRLHCPNRYAGPNIGSVDNHHNGAIELASAEELCPSHGMYAMQVPPTKRFAKARDECCAMIFEQRREPCADLGPRIAHRSPQRQGMTIQGDSHHKLRCLRDSG